MVRILAVLLIVFNAAFCFAEKQLSPSAKIYFFTVGQDKYDITSIWGHIAFLIKDEQNGIDLIYNYGVPAYGSNFVGKLILGKLRFALEAKQTFEQDLKTYSRFQRDISLHELNLTYSEKQKLFEALQENTKFENKYYKYEFYKKNCSTITYELFKNNIEGKIIFKDSLSSLTYRDIFDSRLKDAQIPNYFVRFVAGMKNDNYLETEKLFFIPDLMIENLQKAKIIGPDGERPVFLQSKVIYDFADKRIEFSKLKNPLFYLLFLLTIEIVIFVFSYFKGKNYTKIYDYLWFFIISLSGLFLIFMTFFNNYFITKLNFNMLWANPLFIGIFLFNNEKKVLIFKIITICLLIILPGFIILPQHIYTEFIIITAILILKTLKYGFLKLKFN